MPTKDSGEARLRLLGQNQDFKREFTLVRAAVLADFSYEPLLLRLSSRLHSDVD